MPRVGAVSSIEIDHNDALLDLAPLSQVTSAAYVSVEHNQSLTSLHGLEGLHGPLTSLRVRFNASLQSVAALADISAVSLTLAIRGNPSLAQLSLPSLHFARLFEISYNETLTDLSGLTALTSVEVLEIAGNDALL